MRSASHILSDARHERARNRRCCRRQSRGGHRRRLPCPQAAGAAPADRREFLPMLARLIEYLSRFTEHPDKVLHAFAGLLVFAAGLWATESPLIALGAAFVVGIGKEIYDRRRPLTHTSDPWDTFATVAPGILLWLLLEAGPGGVLPTGGIG